MISSVGKQSDMICGLELMMYDMIFCVAAWRVSDNT